MKTPSFERVPEPGIEIHDPIERRHYVLSTPTPVDPTEIDPDRFYFPVSSAVSFTTDSITLPSVVFTPVRNADGEMLSEVGYGPDESFSAGEYIVELSAPIKCYLRAVGPLSVTTDEERDTMRIDFGRPARVELGARSYHDRPAATVTTTERPRDLMRAVSTFGSALKTTSPERSYPTLRGHPPEVELGDELSIPDGVVRPETGVRIEVPPDPSAIFTVASLAHYLGAEVVPGGVPRVVTETGFSHRLDGPAGFETSVARTLERVLFFDCITRNEGFYDVALVERREIADVVDLDFPALYDRSIPEQLRAYLSVPYERVEPTLPQWRLTSDVVPVPGNAELLPFVVNELAHVRCPESYTPTESPRNAIIDEFTRSKGVPNPEGRADPRPSFVQPEPADSLEQMWAGRGCPVGASKAVAAGYRNRIARTPKTDDIDITVVCNDEEMTAELDSTDDIYGSRDAPNVTVTDHRALSADELTEVLRTDTDFLHYIGHIDANGFECRDGRLDVRTLDRVGVDAFLLNACRSYQQGLAMLERGSFGGVVTLSDVSNTGAVGVGELLARLLNCGFPMRSALNIVREHSFVGTQYIVVGDGGAALTQFDTVQPAVCHVDERDDDYRLSVTTYPPTNQGMGSMCSLQVTEESLYELVAGESQTYEVDEATLREFVTQAEMPVVRDGTLGWSTDYAVQ
ncbi:hypothetical protein [Salinirubrum litoreum]|uniref:CHAT domain-containing protein n=1 Tax=Salinirubrum litoreum TaxID=1126234 RepID=A0ABD5R9E2_9EURY|nr:hypothetical protein [Salinirubrum litoreum]